MILKRIVRSGASPSTNIGWVGCFVAIALLFCSFDACEAQNLDPARLSIVIVPPQGLGWPALFAARYTGTETAIANIVFTYTFSGVTDQSCTYRGRQGTLPCRGRVTEKNYNNAGTYSVTLTAGVPGFATITRTQQFTVSSTVSGSVQRKEVRSMTTTEWNNLVSALHQAKALGVYDHFVYLHQVAGITGVRVGSNRNVAHRGPAFLPWHRAYLRHMERALQVVSGNNQIFIPFWDWTIDQGYAGGPLSSPVWTNTWFGPGGRSDDGYTVRSGPFCSIASSTCAGRWPVLNQLSGPTLDRELGRWGTRLPSQAQVNSIMTVTRFDGGTYDDRTTATSSFRQVLEGWAGGSYGGGHNSVHVFVGGSMSPLSSPNDPVFFFHHCNVDRIWYRWQVLRGCYGACYRPQATDTSVTQSTPGSVFVNGRWRIPGHHWTDTLYPWNIRPSNVADTGNSLIGYTYQY